MKVFILTALLLISTTVACSLAIERNNAVCSIEDPYGELIP